jgi:enediyne biosynthesis protein E4
MAIAVNNIDREPFLYSLARHPSAGWVSLKLSSTKSNRDAIGARVKVRSGKLTQIDEVRSADSYVSCSDIRLHFGLGDARAIDELQIQWPDGTVERRSGLSINREHVLQQGEI